MAEPNDDDRKLIANERTKITATFVNGISIAVFAVGGFAPFISTAMSTERHFGPVFVLMAICWTMAGVLHWAARQSLQDLRS